MPRRRPSASSADAPGLPGPSNGSDPDLADGEPVEQVGQAVVMVGVGVAQDDRVDPPDPSRPERGGDDPAADVRVSHPAAVVKQRAAAWSADEDRQAVIDGQHLGFERCRPFGPQRHREPERQPAGQGPDNPSTSLCMNRRHHQ